MTDSITKVCENPGCNRTFRVSGKAKHRLKCFVCAPSRVLTTAVGVVSSDGMVIETSTRTPVFTSDIENETDRPISELSTDNRRTSGETEKVIRLELKELDFLEKTDGVIALRIASALDGSDLTGPQITTLAKTLREIMQSIRLTAPQAEDEVDELIDRSQTRLTRRL